jgi:uncharacterized membrane protein
MNIRELVSRSILKSITYRIICIISQFIITYLFISDITLTSGIVIVFQTIQTIIYYIHERLWARCELGYKKGGE